MTDPTTTPNPRSIGEEAAACHWRCHHLKSGMSQAGAACGEASNPPDTRITNDMIPAMPFESTGATVTWISRRSAGDCYEHLLDCSGESTVRHQRRVTLFWLEQLFRTELCGPTLTRHNTTDRPGGVWRFSAQDKDSSWNDPFFCAEVGYNAAAVSYYDDGVFWMPWKDVILYFCNIHMSWSTDPDLF